jgi:hypothetical protein
MTRLGAVVLVLFAVTTAAAQPPSPPGSVVIGPAFYLTVTKIGTGVGTVTGPGINCGADCLEPYSPGASVTLTAAPTAGSTFAGWSGPCGGTGACSITMAQAYTVTANFTGTSRTVNLAWADTNAVPNNEGSLEVWSCTGAGCDVPTLGAKLAGTAADVTAYTHSGAQATVDLGYAVRACDTKGANCSAFSPSRYIITAYTLLVSTANTRSNPSPLTGYAASGNIYVFTTPDVEATGVQFFLDDPNRTGPPFHEEGTAPFDFNGTGATASVALPYNTVNLPNGSHTITAAITTAGGVRVISSTFTVGN